MDNYNGFKPKQVDRQAQMFSSPWLTNRIQKMNTNAATNGWTRLKGNLGSQNYVEYSIGL